MRSFSRIDNIYMNIFIICIVYFHKLLDLLCKVRISVRISIPWLQAPNPWNVSHSSGWALKMQISIYDNTVFDEREKKDNRLSKVNLEVCSPSEFSIESCCPHLLHLLYFPWLEFLPSPSTDKRQVSRCCGTPDLPDQEAAPDRVKASPTLGMSRVWPRRVLPLAWAGWGSSQDQPGHQDRHSSVYYHKAWP